MRTRKQSNWNFYTLLKEMPNATTMLENSLAVPYKTEHKFTICPSNPIPRYLFILEKQKCMFTQHLNTNVYSTSIPNCQKLERKQVSFKGWMDGQTVICLFNGRLVSSENEQALDTPNNMNESWRPDAEGKKPASEGYILYDSTYLTFSKGQSGSDGKYSCSCQMSEVGYSWL